MNKNIYYHSKGKNCKSLTKCLTEVKTKFNSVYIKPHAYKPYMSKSIHITIEICRNRSSSKTKWWWIKNQVMFGILSPLLQQKEAQGTNWNKTNLLSNLQNTKKSKCNPGYMSKETNVQEKKLVWYQQRSISVSLSNRLI